MVRSLNPDKLLALIAVIAMAVPGPLVHSHALGEWDVRGHDELTGGVAMLESVEDCGQARHLHDAHRAHHDSCPACVVQSSRVPSAGGTTVIERSDEEQTRGSVLVVALLVSRGTRPDAGRAPPSC